jgi:hypothetical protein
MKQILVPEGLVFPRKDLGVSLDVSALAAAGIIHYEIDGDREWVERDPFNGPEPFPEELRATVEAILTEAEARLEVEGRIAGGVPASVTRRQAKQELLAAGLLDMVQPAIDAIEDEMTRRMVQIYWDDAQDFERDNEWLITLGKQGLGLSDEQIDAFFVGADQR